MTTEMQSFNEKIIEEFRANEGKVEMFAGYPMIILHTIGAKSGDTHLIPLVLTYQDNGDMLLFGSFAGAKKHPGWVFNLRAHPNIDVEVGTEKYAAVISEMPVEEARTTVQAQTVVSDQFAKYVESAAPREIPVFRITRA